MEDEATGEAQLPLDSVGVRLRRAREAAGLSKADIAASTKIPERHLTAIEDGNFAALPGHTYAVGFSRSYARAVGLDEAEIALAMRREVDGIAPITDSRQAPTFEPGDPARVPSSKTAWVAGLVALLVVAAVSVLWRNYYAPAVTLPAIGEPTAAPSAAATQAAAAPDPAVNGGAVTFTALEPGVWVKFYDAAGTQLMQKEMALGETYTVPADAQGPQIWTARPQALSINVGGREVPKLSETQITMKNVPVTAAALLARGTAAATVLPAQTQQATQAAAPARPRQPAAPKQASVRSPVAATFAPPPSAEPQAAPATPSTVTQ
jgi:cytoskeleton protein RodZ